jgi:hypothetical protein
MHKAGAMGRVERVRDDDSDFQRLVDLQRSPRQAICERLSFEILHHEVVGVVLVPDVVERADVLVLKGGDGLGFALEASSQLGIGGGQDFDGDRAIEACVTGAIHLAHPAGPNG